MDEFFSGKISEWLKLLVSNILVNHEGDLIDTEVVQSINESKKLTMLHQKTECFSIKFSCFHGGFRLSWDYIHQKNSMYLRFSPLMSIIFRREFAAVEHFQASPDTPSNKCTYILALKYIYCYWLSTAFNFSCFSKFKI